MPGIIVGSASVTIVPDATGFPNELKAQVGRVGEEIGRQISRSIQDGLRDGLRDTPTGPATEQGRRTGARFADSFKAQVRAALRSLPPVDVGVATSEAEQKLKDLKAELVALGDQEIGIDIDAATATAKIDRIKTELEDLARESPDIAVKADIARASTALAVIQREVDRLRDTPVEVNVGAFTRTFTSKVEAAIHALPDVEITADSSNADRAVAEVRARLVELGDKQIGIDIDEATALAQLEGLRARLEEIGANSPEVRVRANVATAAAELAAIKAEVDRLNGDDATVDVNVDDHGSAAAASRSFSGLAATLISLAPAAIPIGAALVGGIAGAGAAAAAAAGGLGVLALGISGVSDAVKLLGQRQTAAAQDAAKSAASQASSAAQEASAAAQIKSAQQQLGDARRAQAQSAVDSAEKVRDAERSLGDAERAAAQQRVQAYRTVQGAEDDYRRSVQQVQDAERSLADARQQAQRDLQNYADSQVDANLSQQQAVLDLASAQANYDATQSSATATVAQKQQAALDLAKAQQALVEANERLATSTQDNTKAQAQGVAGAPGVVAATKAVSQAKNDQRAAAQKLADAETAAAQQQRASAETIAKAQQGVRDAVRDQGRAQQQAAEQVSRAQDQVASAMRSAAAASAAAGVAGTSALAGINAQLAKVNPATLQFAKFIHNQVAPAFDRLKGTAAAGLLPGLERGLKSLRPAFAPLNQLVGDLSKTLGGLATQAGKSLNSPFWKQFFEYVSQVAGPYLQTFGRIIGNFIKGTAGLFEAFRPITDALGRGILSVSRSFAAFGAGASKNSGFQSFLRYIRDNGPVVVDAIKNIAQIVGKLIIGLAPLGHVLIVVIDAIARFLAKLSPDQLLLVVAAIGGLVAILGGPLIAAVVAGTALAALFVRHWSQIKPAIQPVLDIFAALWSFVRDKLVPVLVGILGKAWDGIKAALRSINGAIASHRDQLDALGHAWLAVNGFIVTKILPILGPILKGLFEGLGHIIAGFIDVTAFLVSAFQAIWDTASSMVSWFSGPFVNFFTGAWAAVQSAFASVLQWVQNTWSTDWAAVQALITGPVSSAKQYLAGVWTSIQSAFTSIRDWVRDRWSTSWARMKDLITAPVTAAKTFLGGVWADIKSAFTSVHDWVRDRWSVAWDRVKDLITAPIRGAKSVIATIWGDIKTAARTFVTDMKTIWTKLEGVFKAPIAWVVDHVFNDGILKAWNVAADVLPGVDKINPIKLAGGGPARGRGTGTSDEIHALLSNGEHVWTAREVAGAGGHAKVAQMRAAAAGSDDASRFARFAAGGPVTLASLQSEVQSMNPKPYVWDEAGPSGYDCSGAVSHIYNLIKGLPEYLHTFSTVNEAGYFKPGTGVFTVGVTHDGSEQHTAGSIGGLKFEARDPQEGILVGAAARDPRSFARTLYLPEAQRLTGAGASGGGSLLGSVIGGIGGVVSDLNPLKWVHYLEGKFKSAMADIHRYDGTAKDASQIGQMVVGLPTGITKAMLNKVKSIPSDVVGGIGGYLAGGGPSVSGSHTKLISEALSDAEIPVNNATIGAMNLIVSNESGWNPTAVNRTDINWQEGHPSVGLAQVIAGTYAAHVPPSLRNVGPFAYGVSENPIANMAAAANYAESRYGSLLEVPGVISVAHGGSYVGYDNGGQLQPGPQLVYNGTGGPEAVLTDAQWNTMATLARAGARSGVARFEGDLFLDSGEFIGRVRGEANDVMDKRVAGGKHAASTGVPGGALGALSSNHARAASR